MVRQRRPRVDSFVIGLNDWGGGQLVLPGSHEPVIGNATTGVIYGVEPRTRAIGSDLHGRLLLRLPARLLRRKLEALLEGQQSTLSHSTRHSIRCAAPAPQSAACS